MSSNQPNILLFVPDGMQAKATGPGHPCFTPNMDRVAEEGVRFTRAYTPSPTCSPARASLMTGLLPHNHGVLQVEHCVDDDQSVLRLDRAHWAEHLAAAGYRTGYFGKWHIERSNDLHSFGWRHDCGWRSDTYRELRDKLALESESMSGELTYYQQASDGYHPHLHHGVTELAPEDREVSVPVDLALPFLDSVLQSEEPWACCVSFAGPNESLICSKETFDRYDLDNIELPSTLGDALENRPGVYKRYQNAWSAFTAGDWRRAIACYYSRITEIDAQLGRLLEKLDTAGALEKTVVIVTSDHGRYLGAHGMDGHNYGGFEEIYSIPLIVSGPGVASGDTTGARVGLHDLHPTILDICGVPVAEVPDSCSFADALKQPAGAEDAHHTGFAEYHGTRFPLAQRIIWERDWKFIFNGFDFDEFYNLRDDPGETTNLLRDTKCADRARDMMKAMWKIIVATGDKPLATSHYYSLQLADVGPEV